MHITSLNKLNEKTKFMIGYLELNFQALLKATRREFILPIKPHPSECWLVQT